MQQADDVGTRLRLLLVEDHDDIAELTLLMIGMLGHDASRAASVSAAEAILRSQPIDLLITDFRLPDGTGLDLLDRLPRPLAVLVSALPHDSIDMELRAGFFVVLEKPLELDALARCLEEVRRRRQ